MSLLWAKGFFDHLDDCVCVLSDLTQLPLLGGGRKSWYVIIATSIVYEFSLLS